MTPSLGLVVGKFAPLHRGHEHLIAVARAACDELIILSYAKPEPPGCEGARRAAWLAARFPGERSQVVTDAWLAARAPGVTVPADDAPDDVHRRFCAFVLRDLLAAPVDAVFTSEAYGPGFAAVLARELARPVVHVAVDPARAAVPISATKIRADVHAHRAWLAPEVYASFVTRVALLGGESTGKSTLAEALAATLATTFVGEYGRERWLAQGGRLDRADLLAIAEEQVRREDAALLAAHRVLVCDSTPLTTRLYSEAMFGDVEPRLAALAARPYDVTFLCAPDFPFVQDGTRQDAAFRDRGHAWYLRELAAAGVAFHPLHGPLADRVAAAVAVLGR